MRFRYKEKRYHRTVSYNDIVNDVISEIGLSDDMIMEQIRSLWPNVVDDIIATHSYPYKIVNKVLYVMVDHPIYANELSLSQAVIIKKFSEFVNFLSVNAVKCTIGREKYRKKRRNVCPHR